MSGEFKYFSQANNELCQYSLIPSTITPSKSKRNNLLECTQVNFKTGPLGFEPRNVETKTRCLTTWRRPNEPLL